MAWRIAESVTRGEIDNRTKGVVTGKIWLAGRDDPICLELRGNAHRDLAGRRLTFENPNPKPDPEINLHPQQAGVVGDMTASRKVRIFDVPLDQALDVIESGGKPSEHLANSIYLEWYSDFNGRIVVESAEFRLAIEAPAWKMSEREQEDQLQANASAARLWMERLANLAPPPPRRMEDKPEDEGPMDEFEWEKFLKTSDARTEHYGKLLEQFKDLDADSRERIVARAMGWPHIEAYLDAVERGEKDEATDAEADGVDDPPELEPNPLTEGVDWIRNKEGYVEHPLVRRAAELSIAMWRACHKDGDKDALAPEPVEDMTFCAHMVSAKLAGALNDLAYEDEPDRGFLVAYLKRALKYLHDALRRLDQARKLGLLPPRFQDRFKPELFAVRAEILRLMRQHRKA